MTCLSVVISAVSNLPTIEEALEELELEWPRNNKIACPACGSEDTPALHLYDDHFYCFSCGKSGDGIGLVALYTGQNIRSLVAKRGSGARPARLATKTMTRRGVNRAVYRQWQEVHNWWFNLLHDIYKDAAVWSFERALDLWSDVFDTLQAEIRGQQGFEALAPFEAEQRIKDLKRKLAEAEPHERKSALESRMR